MAASARSPNQLCRFRSISIPSNGATNHGHLRTLLLRHPSKNVDIVVGGFGLVVQLLGVACDAPAGLLH